MTTEVVDRQERRKTRAPQAIQTAALELFGERGYRETTHGEAEQHAVSASKTWNARILSATAR